MKTITEDYVSNETAQLLRDKGFDEGCHSFYDYAQRLQSIETVIYDSELSEEDNECVAPTLQMVRKWLLKKYNIFICVLFLEEFNGFGYTIENTLKKEYIATSKNSSYKEPEEAAEMAIKYCLINLI